MHVETHVTVVQPPDAAPALRAWVETHGLRITHVELSRGAHPQQTMITSRGSGPWERSVHEAHSTRAALRPLGVEVRRIKVEVDARAEGVAARYLEHHVKVSVPRGRLAALGSLAAARGAHLSRTASRVLHDEEERFLTQRFSSSATSAASDALAALLAALRRAHVPVVRVERERVVHDDNLPLDAGWTAEVSP